MNKNLSRTAMAKDKKAWSIRFTLPSQQYILCVK